MDKIKINIGGIIVETDKEKVSNAIETGELKIESEEIIVLKKSDKNVVYEKDKFETFKTNLSNEQYIKGRLDSAEMLTKEIKKSTGLDFEIKIIKKDNGNVDFEETSKHFVTNLTPKLEEKIGIKPDKKVKEAQEDLKKVQGNFLDIEEEFNNFKSGITKKELRIKKDNAILFYIPNEGLIVSKNIALSALKHEKGFDIDISEEGKQIPMINGNIKKDEKTLAAVDVKIFIADLLSDLKLTKKAKGGGGGGDESGSGQATDYDKFVKEMKSQNIDEGSREFSEEMDKRIKEKTLIV